MRKSSIASSLGAVSISLLIGLVAVELGLRAFWPQELYSSPHEEHSSGLVVNRSPGTIRHFKAPNNAIQTLDPLHLRKTVGFDGPSSNKLLFVGDSFTFGFLLSDRDTYLSRLQVRNPRTQFLNGGTSGYGLEQSVKFIDLFCAAHKPSAVVLALNFDDLERSLPQTHYKLDEATGLVKEVVPSRDTSSSRTVRQLVRSMPGYQWVGENMYVFSLVRQGLQKILTPRSWTVLSQRASVLQTRSSMEPTQRDLALMKALILEYASSSRSCGAEPIIIYLGWIATDGPVQGQTLTTRALSRLIDSDFF